MLKAKHCQIKKLLQFFPPALHLVESRDIHWAIWLAVWQTSKSDWMIFSNQLFLKTSALSVSLSHLNYGCILRFLSKKYLRQMSVLQFNLHETDLLFRYLSHHFWHGIVPVFMKICTDLFLLLFLNNCAQLAKLFKNNNKNNFALKSVQICANLHKSWNNMMSNGNLIIENMDLSRIHLAVRTHK